MGFGYGGYDLFFQFFPLIFGITFLIAIAAVVVTIVKSIAEWNKNNHSPRLTVEATVVAKRTDISRHSHKHGHHRHHTTSTYYYVTFQVESGDRMELSVDGSEYGMLVEGDKGRLSFQGTRYLSFQGM